MTALHRRPHKSLAFWLFLLYAVVSRFLVTGSKGGTLSIVILVFLILFGRAGRVRILVVVAFGIGALIAASWMQDFRQQSRQLSSITGFEDEKSIAERIGDTVDHLVKYSADSSGIYPLLYYVPDRDPLRWGATYLAIPAAPIPRAFWSGKPHASGKTIALRYYGTDNNTIPATAVGEAYWNFHIPGVIVIFALWGIFLRWVWNITKASMRTAPGVAVIYLLTIYSLEPFTESVYRWMHATVPAVLILLLLTGYLRVSITNRRSQCADRSAPTFSRTGYADGNGTHGVGQE